MKVNKINLYLIVVFLIFIPFLTACQKKSNKSADNNGNNWKKDVLYAKKCGMDGLPCCENQDKRCFYNQQCCVDPNNPKRNKCSDTCECGGKGEFCCSKNPICQEGLTCFNGDCVSCGGKGQPCCGSGNSCQGNLVCYQDNCVLCGLDNNPCCPKKPTCINEDNISIPHSECKNGICDPCGYGEYSACDKDPVCLNNNILNNGHCLSCGEFNQPCCKKGKYADYECDSNLICQLGFCNKK